MLAELAAMAHTNRTATHFLRRQHHECRSEPTTSDSHKFVCVDMCVCHFEDAVASCRPHYSATSSRQCVQCWIASNSITVSPKRWMSLREQASTSHTHRGANIVVATLTEKWAAVANKKCVNSSLFVFFQLTWVNTRANKKKTNKNKNQIKIKNKDGNFPRATKKNKQIKIKIKYK